MTKERPIIWLLRLLAIVHVFVYSAAFPLFNNVDEPMHFDLALKYSANGIPHGIDPVSDESLDYIVLFSTSEYFVNPTNFPGGRFPPPPWTQPAEKIGPTLVAEKKMGSQLLNYEDTEPPLYYELAAAWWQIGKWCGVHGGSLPYWLRFLNILFMPALVWTAYAVAKIVFPENSFARVGVPALVAFMPQTAFYSISDDILSPLCFGLTLICLLLFLDVERPSVPLGILTGAALAATFLAKTTNLPLIALSLASILLKVLAQIHEGKLKASLPSLVALFGCAGLPAILWMAWCRHFYGDYTGSAAKARAWGWTVKPFSQWWQHPMFTPIGFWTYLSGQMGTFWQGEFRWHNNLLVVPGSITIYTLLSMALVTAVVPALWRTQQGVAPLQRKALWLSLVYFASALGFFALASIVYDFHDCVNPSRKHPFFQAGRMMLGALIPFLLLFVYGLDRVLYRFGNRIKFATLGAMILGMLLAEIAADWPVFSNPYNWFHLPR